MRGDMKRFLQVLKRAWLWFARKLSRGNTVVLLSIVYVAVVGPMRLVSAILRRDLLDKRPKKSGSTYWQARPLSESTVERHTHQF